MNTNNNNDKLEHLLDETLDPPTIRITCHNCRKPTEAVEGSVCWCTGCASRLIANRRSAANKLVAGQKATKKKK